MVTANAYGLEWKNNDNEGAKGTKVLLPKGTRAMVIYAQESGSSEVRCMVTGHIPPVMMLSNHDIDVSTTYYVIIHQQYHDIIIHTLH